MKEGEVNEKLNNFKNRLLADMTTVERQGIF